nr:LysR family transcriptional regulator [Kineosporia rhizophila]
MVADVDTQLLKTFRAVAETGSISRAAARLGYTQSAVSRQIGVLETTLGRALLDRLPRGVALTEAGQALLPHAQAVLERLDAAGLELEDLDQLRRGRLRVGAFATAISTLVPQALARFRSQHPQVTTTLTEGRTPELLRRLDAGEADVVVVSTAEGHNLHEPRYQLHHLLDEPMMLAVPRNHRLARRRTVRLAEFTGEVFVVGSRTDDQSFLQARLPADSPPRADIVVTGWNAKWGCVAAGLGVALVPSLAVRGTPGDIALLRLHRQDEAVRQVFAAVRAGRTIAPPVAAFLPELGQVAAGLR